MKFIHFIASIFISFIIHVYAGDDDELAINFLPSEKYRLNKKDLINLKTDIERQLMQRIYEIQSNYEEREKLRLYATNKPMVVPPYSTFQQPNFVLGSGGGLNAQVNVGHSDHHHEDDSHSRSFINDDEEKNSDVDDENKIIEKKLTNLVKTKFAKELETEIMLTKQAIGSIKKEIEETKKIESKPASITNIYHNVPNPFNPNFDKPRKGIYEFKAVENEKVFEDKIETPGKGNFPSFAQKSHNITKSHTNSTVKKPNLNKNINKTLIKSVSSFVEGKSNLTQAEIEKRLRENGFNNTEEFINTLSKGKNKIQNKLKKVQHETNALNIQKEAPLSKRSFKKARFLQTSRPDDILPYHFHDKKFSKLLDYYNKYKKFPSVMPAELTPKSDMNGKKEDEIPHRPHGPEGEVTYSQFKEKTSKLLNSNAENGPVLVDLDTNDLNN